jgi:hypothetical protein
MSWFDILKYDVGTTYMVRNEIWDEAGGEGTDTIPVLEEKLGRKLTLEDFGPHPANWSSYTLRDDQDSNLAHILMDRIGGIEGKKELARQYLELDWWSEESMHPGKTMEYVKEAEELLGETNG